MKVIDHKANGNNNNSNNAQYPQQQPQQHMQSRDASGYLHQSWCNGQCGAHCNDGVMKQQQPPSATAKEVPEIAQVVAENGVDQTTSASFTRRSEAQRATPSTRPKTYADAAAGKRSSSVHKYRGVEYSGDEQAERVVADLQRSRTISINF